METQASTGLSVLLELQIENLRSTPQCLSVLAAAMLSYLQASFVPVPSTSSSGYLGLVLVGMGEKN